MVTYIELPHTDEEFAVLMAQNADEAALAIVDRSKQAYRDLETYADTGTMERSEDGESTDSATFKTLKDANGDILFDYQEPDPTFDPSHCVLSRRGDRIQVGTDYKSEVSIEDDISMAISSLTGVTMGTVGNILTLLLEVEGPSLFNLAQLTQLEDAEAHDGTQCQRIQGTSFLGGVCIVWIGKEDHLIYQIEEAMGDKTYEIITYSPQPNVAISPEDLAFQPPAYR